jgi:GR25 family glycosyltransferase involved in LPS biosynthesis
MTYFYFNKHVKTQSKAVKVDNLNIDRIYIINLEHRKDRWLKMMKRVKKWPSHLIYKIERFNAYKGEDVNINIQNFSRIGELGCAYSHYKIWLDAYNKNYENVLIFEDDIVFHKKWWEHLNLYREASFDGLFLNFSDPLTIKNKWTKISKQHMAGGYLLSRSGLKLLLDKFNENNLYVADTMTWWLQDQQNCFGYYPWLCIQEGLDSDIQSSDHLLDDVKKVNKYIRRKDYDF